MEPARLGPLASLPGSATRLGVDTQHTFRALHLDTYRIPALPGSEAESAEISSDMPTPDVTPMSARP